LQRFTDRQVELGRLIAEGLTYQEIADRLGVSSSTVRQRTDRLRWILGVEKKRQIPAVMRALGLID
jgi:DNA-binding NarL/FixJ family response regulator